VELADHRRILPLVSFAHGEPEIDRLVRALKEMVAARAGSRNGRRTPEMPTGEELRTQQAMVPREAFFSATEQVKPKAAVGRVSAELVTPYPPGIPVTAPGEIITDTIVDYLEAFVANGGFVEGAADQTLDRFRVVA
jgi:arginine/lysine/ornithine decarboxylase